MLIGLHGQARSGKDTIYRLIEEDFGGTGVKVTRDAFADRMILSMCRLFFPNADLTFALAWWKWFKEDGDIDVAVQAADRLTIDGRTVGQRYGTESHRHIFGEDFWVDVVLPNWQDDDYGRMDGLTRSDILVITDVRFENEAERILDCGGCLWRITRPGTPEYEHSSARVLPDEYFTYHIENKTNLDALRAKVQLGVWNEALRQVP